MATFDGPELSLTPEPVAVTVVVAVAAVVFPMATNVGLSVKVVPEQQVWSVPQQYDPLSHIVTREVQSEFPPAYETRVVIMNLQLLRALWNALLFGLIDLLTSSSQRVLLKQFGLSQVLSVQKSLQ